METDDVANPESLKPVEEDDDAKDTSEEEADEVEEEETSQKPDADEESAVNAASSPKAAEDAPEESGNAPMVEERDGAAAEPADPEETTRDVDDATDKPVEETPATDGDEYQWEISCCGVDIPLSK